MCEKPVYAAILKPEYDIKFQRTGVRTQMRILGSVANYCLNDVYRLFPTDKYNIIMKECGSCPTCRYKQASQKAAQAYCESKCHDDNSFITLTFGDLDVFKYLVSEKKMSRYKAKKYMNYLTWSLDNKIFADFMKRLRMTLYREKLRKWIFDNNYDFVLVKSIKKFDDNKGVLVDFYKSPDYALKRYENAFGVKFNYPKPDNIRLLHCGEYGSSLGSQRPHHHAIIFGYNPTDTYKEHTYRNGQPYVRTRSKTLDKLWKYGISQVDDCNFHSINYVSRYITKKMTGQAADEWYNGRKPDYVTSSTSSGGLGKDYFLKYFDMFKSRKKVDVYSSIHNKLIPISLPRYFKTLWKSIEPTSYNEYVAELMSNMEVDINKMYLKPEYLEDKKADFNAQGVKTLRIAKEAIRIMERTDEPTNVLQRKALAFGLDDNFINMHKDLCGKYLSKCSYHDYKQKLLNPNIQKKFDNYEKLRSKMINFHKKRGDDNIVYMYEHIKNPYAIKGRCVHSNVVVPDKCYIGIDNDEVLYA